MKRLLVVVSLVVAAGAGAGRAQVVKFTPIPHGPFYIRSYLGSCMTLDIETPPIETDPAPSNPLGVSMEPCSLGGIPQLNSRLQVTVTEINSSHNVILKVGNEVLGVPSSQLTPGSALTIQNYTASPGQIWAFDGDSFILVANRNLVAEVQNARTLPHTPIVLGQRDLDDSEFWALQATDGTDKKPTNGFVRVPSETDLRSALSHASTGTVIEIEADTTIRLDDCYAYAGACPPGQAVGTWPLVVPAGVTVRGNRHGTTLGPVLSMTSFPDTWTAFDVEGSDARITGLRLLGPSPTIDSNPDLIGVFVHDPSARRAVVDHNEVSGWTLSGVNVAADVGATDFECVAQVTPPRTVKVVANFVHHNAMAEKGYGVSTGKNGFATILGNTFQYNRHAIAADGHRGTGYRAWSNLVLSGAPEYGLLGEVEHDFDMHGTEGGDSHWGGIGGSDVDIAWNTFLATKPTVQTRHNYKLRGVPCELHRFRHNVSRQNQYQAVLWFGEDPFHPVLPDWLEISNDKFSHADPTDQLAVGDFDGDGRKDVFLATGAAWYYAPAGVAEWHFLNMQAQEINNLRFGDVDGDGRTDVLNKAGDTWRVSWGGVSPFEAINTSTGPIADFAVGDFNGDGKADLFYSDGSQWLVSYGSVGPFTPLPYPWAKRVKDLRFGDFNGDGRTDIFAVMGPSWEVRYGGGFSAILRPALTSSVADLLIGDFDGNGRSDVALANSMTWKVSFDATGNWMTLRTSGRTLNQELAVGDFDGLLGDDVLGWELLSAPLGLPPPATKYFELYSGGRADPERFSQNEMR